MGRAAQMPGWSRGFMEGNMLTAWTGRGCGAELEREIT